MRFDVTVLQIVPWPSMVEDVQYLDASGFGTVWVGDHFVFPPLPGIPMLESWTTLAALATNTKRVRLGTMVTDVALRHPAMLAKQAATVDLISRGRLDLGIGAGYYEAELASLGVPALTPPARIARLRESAHVIDAMLRGEFVTYEGCYVTLRGVQLVPGSTQRPRPPLMIAANGRQAMRVAARYADIWVSLGNETSTGATALDTLTTRNRLFNECCGEIDREPTSVERAYFVGWAEEFPFASPDALEDFLGGCHDAGIHRLIFFYASDRVPYGDPVVKGRYLDRIRLESFVGDMLFPSG